MTRARWVTGSVIGAGALVVAGQALVAYVEGRLVVGVVAVLVLLAVMGIGLASLARASRYMARELAALRADPPGGTLYEARRQQLGALQRRGVAPDLDVLADATAAEEAERGYTGKYLVATTVLIGLVGTFGGLMETLARVAPLLKNDLGPGGAAGALGLVAAPLAGLHVTFGTSVVAILVTLSLALIQGDVTLHHERMLALLQERTRHVLVPALWAGEENAAERTVRALQELRAFVGEALTKGAAANAEKVAAAVRGEVQRLVEKIGAETRAAATAQTAALERAGASTTDGLRQASEAASRELREAATAARDALISAAAKSHETIATAAAKSHETTTTAAASAREALDRASSALLESTAAAGAALRGELAAAAAAARDTATDASTASLEATGAAAVALREAVEAATGASREALDRAATAMRDLTTSTVAALAASTTQSAEAFAATTTAAAEALRDLRASLSADLESSSRELAAAATSLQGSVQALSPALTELAPQLGALTAEVALLAARAESPEQPNAVLDELVRLGEDVERLVASSQPPPTLARETES